jgi:hypothetical protein
VQFRTNRAATLYPSFFLILAGSANKQPNAVVIAGTAAAQSPEHRSRLDRLALAIETTFVRPAMKSVYVSAAAFALTAAVNLSPVLAQGPKALGGERNQPLTTPSSAAVTSAGHYEYRYGYDKHARWRGHWIFIR